jgi:hypothetical protein
MLTMALSAYYISQMAHCAKFIAKGRKRMRSLLLAAVFASTSVLALAADNASITGKWTIHNNIAGNESDIDCAFTQAGADLTATCKSENGDAKATGKVDGNKVTFTIESEYQGSPVTSKYTGTFDSAASKISGTVTVEQFSVDGDFTATHGK